LSFITCLAALQVGCSTPSASRVKSVDPERSADRHRAATSPEPPVRLTLQSQDANGDKKPPLTPKPPAPEDFDSPPRLLSEREDPPEALQLPEVVASVHATFPLIDAALQEIPIAEGKRIAALGAFDTKLKAASENGPVGFYQTYRNNAGFEQPIYHGGEFFSGYRIGRGDFQPWYLERQTNDGGEFKAGLRVPLARDREIDARRADLWRADYDRQLARPEIRGQLINFVRDASVLYWSWVAAGRRYEIGRAALDLSLERNEGFKKRVEEGDLDPPALRDNERSIANRQAKLIDLERKLEQSAVKLSLFLRTTDGVPRIPARNQLPTFPTPQPVDLANQPTDIQTALAARPELESLELLRQRVEVDAAEAANDLKPNVDAQIIGSQDVGEPTSKKRDKSRFELEVGLFVDVPLQRRKGFGKLETARGKQAQLTAKRQFTEDKIVAEVRAVYVALRAAYDRVAKTREAREGAEALAEIERRKFELGQSDLLSVFQREQLAIEAAVSEVDALLDYYIARADYAAALAYQWVNENAEPKRTPADDGVEVAPLHHPN